MEKSKFSVGEEMTNSQANTVTDSQFYMWRCIAALSAVDGKVTEEETQLVRSYIEKLPFTEAQKSSVESEWGDPSTPEELFKKVTLPRDRSLFIYYARLLFWSDGDFDAQEKAVLEAFHQDIMSGHDLGEIMHSVDRQLKDFHFEHERRAGSRSRGQTLVDALTFWDVD